MTGDNIKVSIRTDGTYRVFLDNVEPEQSAQFINCVKEVLIADKPTSHILIPKHEYLVGDVEAEEHSEEKGKRDFSAPI